jgi:hypothetical protein
MPASGTERLPLPLCTMDFRYFMVEKLVLNVLSFTVGVLAELTAGNIATTKLPTNATDASAFAVLNFIVPNPSLEPCGPDSLSTSEQ